MYGTNGQQNIPIYLLLNIIYFFKLFFLRKEIKEKLNFEWELEQRFWNSIIVNILGARMAPINMRHFLLNTNNVCCN